MFKDKTGSFWYRTWMVSLPLAASAMLVACSRESVGDKNRATPGEHAQEVVAAADLRRDTFPLRGSYRWTFELAGFTQVSTHTFDENQIAYSMEGRVYATEYTMRMVSYDADDRKWIGHDDEHHYAMFIDPQEDGRLNMYKHKCAGLAEALAFARPAPDATEDHGWNIYTRFGETELADELPLAGTYRSESGSLSLALADAAVSMDSVEYRKLTYHGGERRWVGNAGARYLLMFWRSEDPSNVVIEVAVATTDDMERAYSINQGELEASQWQQLRREDP